MYSCVTAIQHSCTKNMTQIIKKHNKKLENNNNTTETNNQQLWGQINMPPSRKLPKKNCGLFGHHKDEQFNKILHRRHGGNLQIKNINSCSQIKNTQTIQLYQYTFGN